MDPDFSRLDAYLDDNGLDGYLLNADGEDSDQRYLSGFTAPDPFVTLYTGEVHVLVSSLEYGRAKREARADTVERHADYDGHAKIEEHGLTEGHQLVLAEFLDAHDAEVVAAPEEFPLGTADGLRAHGVEINADHEGVIQHIRANKLPEELEHIREAQQANERSMATAERMIRDADVNGDGELVYDGELLTSERVKEEIEVSLLRDGCSLDTTIVACGADAADPHDRGSGPLRADESIIIDIFPRDKESGYFADMTRTFVKDEPSDTIQDWYDLTLEAQEAALDALGPGVSGSEVHAAVCDVYEDAGWPTLRSDPETETGFIHTTGHGVGLDIHEYPRVSTAENELEPGHVVTIEPGLYDPQYGGVRIEDIVVVTEDGYENFTDYEKTLVV
ncbi:M24 family metallopeptidase [Halorarius litoreus]|uniref:M24 family metallopeptidase n=1 Tax=Halorarius litoreus TaxID=2962676 RepID=UPI0020CBC10B|nr:Xaa-Pro peptidase family protein [Halorarius litoreus]